MSVLSRINVKLKKLFSSSIRLARVSDFASYAKQNTGVKFNLIETGRKTKVCPVQLFEHLQVGREEVQLPDTYWVELSGAGVIGDSSVVVTADNVVLYDMLYRRKEYGANMTDHGLLLLFGKAHFCGEKVFYNYRKEKVERIPRAISLAANMSDNYYHFMHTVAAKFSYLSSIGLDANIPLLVDECVLATPQLKEILDKLNVYSRDIIPLKAGVRYNVEDLFCLSEPNIVVPNFLKGKDNIKGFAFDSKALAFIRAAFVSSNDGQSKLYPSRLFLSRKNCKKRRCNEDDILPILENYGFTPVFTETMTVSEQAALFNSAEHIIGATGAAFTNLLFCKEGTRALIFETGDASCFSSLAGAVGVDICYMNGTPLKEDKHSDFEVDTGLVSRYLELFYGKNQVIF